MTNKSIQILLVEDNPRDEELTIHSLKRNHVTNDIHVCHDGQEALDYLFGDEAQRGGVPRLILLDLKLPKVSGLDVLKRIKADAGLRVVPVVVLTSSKEESDLVTSYSLGVNSYVVKPVQFEQFTEAVRTLGLYWLLLNEPPGKI